MHSSKIRDLFNDGRITDNSLLERIKTSLNKACELYELALEKGIPIIEPFEGEKIGEFQVLSPNREWYINDLLPYFPDMLEVKEESYVEKAAKAIYAKLKEWIDETWDIETLSEDSESTGVRNESSVVLYADIEDRKILLTGDAGKEALNHSVDYAESLNIDLTECTFVQIPHHGSRRNVSTSVLNRILGNIKEEGESPDKTAYVSVAKEVEEHPKKIVVNVFIRRGTKVCETRWNTIRYSINMSVRSGWVPLTPLSFNSKVEN